MSSIPETTAPPTPQRQSTSSVAITQGRPKNPQSVDARQFLKRLENGIDYAFQPIVNINSGRCYGVEALMRGWQTTGLESIDGVLDFAHEQNVLVEADAILKRLAFQKFSRIPHARDMRVFFNLDNRLFSSAAYSPQRTVCVLEQYNLQPSSVVLEVSERKHLERGKGSSRILADYHNSTVQMALDDFGTGFSGLALLYDTHPEYVKIDRYFISNIGNDPRKKLFVSHVVGLAKTLGIRVVAEGVETAAELFTCRQIGCDLVQGYFIQRPTTDLHFLRPEYAEVKQLGAQDRRTTGIAPALILEQLDRAPAVDATMQMEDVFKLFRNNPQRCFFPFLGTNGEPIGVMRETELKEYIYSPFGRDLLARKNIEDHLDLFVQRCPVADVHTSIDTILKQFAVCPSRDGVLITDDGSYIGVLSAEALVLAVQERNLELARDQNPLTGRPGNPSIERFICDQQCTGHAAALMYFDLDNFKIFNDRYGFRIGDRALQMFSEILGKAFSLFDAFIGHIGGDDFFVGVIDRDFETVHAAASGAICEFKSSAESLYDQADRQLGFLVGLDRQGKRKAFPLLSASCALLTVANETASRSEQAILSTITNLKEESKLSGNTVCAASLV